MSHEAAGWTGTGSTRRSANDVNAAGDGSSAAIQPASSKRQSHGIERPKTDQAIERQYSIAARACAGTTAHGLGCSREAEDCQTVQRSVRMINPKQRRCRQPRAAAKVKRHAAEFDGDWLQATFAAECGELR